MKILVTASLGIGDIVEATPLCHALHLLGHTVDLHLDTGHPEQISPLFEGWPVLGTIHCNTRGIDYSEYDLGIRTHGFPGTKSRFPPGLEFCVHILEVRHRSAWVTEANLSPARLLGYRGPVPAGHVQASARHFPIPAGSVVIHAGCRKTTSRKRWEHWPEVCARLVSAGRHVIIVGTEEDRSEDGWESEFDTRFDLTLLDLAALLDQSAFYLGNDSGVGHIAAALGLPGLLLFGPSNHTVYRPNSAVLRTMLPDRTHTQPRAVNPTKAAINHLGLDQVWTRIVALLDDPSRDPPRGLPDRAIRPVRIPLEAHVPYRDNYSDGKLEYSFAASADSLMRGQSRAVVSARVRDQVADAHIAHSWRALLRIAAPGDSVDDGEYSIGRYHAGRGIETGLLFRGILLLAAFWILKRMVFVKPILHAWMNWIHRNRHSPR